MTRSAKFAIQLSVTAVGALLDYLVGRLTNKLSLGIACWALLTLLAAAGIDFVRDARDSHRSPGYPSNWDTSRSGLLAVAGIIRGRIDRFRWATMRNAIFIGALAGIAGYAFSLAVITFRLLAVSGGPALGKHSRFDSSAISFISNFQASSTTAWLIIACFVIALILRPPVVLPLGVIAVSVANATIVTLPMLSPVGSAMRTQIARSLAAPDLWLFRLPATAVLYGCAIPFALGLIVCGMINARLS